MLTKILSFCKNWLGPNLPIKVFAELSASMIFHFIGSLSPTPYANGIALIVLVYYTAKISGAHLNPALSLTFTLLGYTNPLEMLVYWFAQVTGCIIGALWIKLLVPTSMNFLNQGCFYPNAYIDNKLILGWEGFCTFTFLLPIFTVVWYTIHKAGYGNTGPIIVGLSLIANAFAAGPFTGAALNPARVLGSLIVFQCDKTHSLYYILGEFLGAAMVPLCVIPFYGINEKAWWLQFLPPSKPKTWIVDHQENVKNTKEVPKYIVIPDTNTNVNHRSSYESQIAILIDSPKPCEPPNLTVSPKPKSILEIKTSNVSDSNKSSLETPISK